MSQNPGGALAPALPGERLTLKGPAGTLNCYADGPLDSGLPPLLLVHSINAAASAYDVRPIYLHFLQQRRVYALELPGFGLSARPARRYTPALMADAIVALLDHLRDRYGDARYDGLAISLGADYLARAALLRDDSFNSLALISPYGFDRRAPYDAPPGSHQGSAWKHALLRFPLWDRGFFALLRPRPIMRFFLQQIWGPTPLDDGLLDYDAVTMRQPGARFAPYSFLSGYLFSRDITTVYRALQPPVWLAYPSHGMLNFSRVDTIADRTNWTLQRFDSGAMPQFECPNVFLDAYQEFLDDSRSGGR